jgi:nucleoid-associated protein YgaU
MKQNFIKELPQLRVENFENIFNIYQDKDSMYFYNILQTIQIPLDLPEGYYDTYNVGYEDTWPYISYKLYRTPNLWWLITHANNIVNPTKIPTPGTTLKVFKSGVVKIILEQISTQDT